MQRKDASYRWDRTIPEKIQLAHEKYRPHFHMTSSKFIANVFPTPEIIPELSQQIAVLDPLPNLGSCSAPFSLRDTAWKGCSRERQHFPYECLGKDFIRRSATGQNTEDTHQHRQTLTQRMDVLPYNRSRHASKQVSKRKSSRFPPHRRSLLIESGKSEIATHDILVAKNAVDRSREEIFPTCASEQYHMPLDFGSPAHPMVARTC